MQRRAPDNAAYNTAFSVNVRSPIVASALRRAFQTIVDRHAALRTTFALDANKPVAVVHGRQDVSLTLLDARNQSTDELRTRVGEDYRQPFDLDRGPLLRVGLYSRGDEDHVLLIAVHHIVCDAWSMWMLMHELSILYPVIAGGGSAELPPVQAQYADFVRWQDHLLAGPEGERLWQYWRDKLSGDLPVLDLPMSRPRPALPALKGASHFFHIDERLVRGLAETAKAQGTTLYVCLLAVFYTLLHRYTEQDDIIVGSPVAGRNNPDMAATVGYFANPLPLRADLSGDPSFQSLVGQVRETVLGALAHQDLPFPLLIEKLQPKRDPSRWPVFQVMLVLQSPPSSAEFRGLADADCATSATWGDLHLEPFNLPQMEGQFDLTWEIVETQGWLSCVIKYNTDLLDQEAVERMAGHLNTLIEAVVNDPEQRISRLALMPLHERQCVLSEWQGPQVAYPLDRCLHHWIEDQVERTPEAVAVVMADSEGRRLSYRELNGQANQLARHLQSLGVGPGSAVGVLAERSLDLVIALLGVLKAGGAYVPLDPEYPARRLESMMADAQIAVLLTHGKLAERVPTQSVPIIRLDADQDLIEQYDVANLLAPVGPDDLAYVIFTSGSTGQPKGAENTHRGVCNRLLWMQDAYRLDGSDHVLQKTPFSFDVSVWEFFWPLITGAVLVMARPGGHKDRDYLADTIAAQRITTLHFVPSMLHVFLGAKSLAACQATMRRVFCSGEALPARLTQQFFDRFDVELYNLYGPTEAAVDVTHWQCRPDSKLPTVPIGKPIANTRIYLLDRNLQPVPVGVTGELYIGGVGLARGYRNRPLLTAEKFVSIAVRDGETERLYRTGDVCRWLPDGNIEYLHRADFQVKLRGFRIELGEIEAALGAHPGVQEAVVRLDDSGPSAQLLAWIVPRQTGEPWPDDELRRFLRERLPEYMIPARLTRLPSLPLTPNGKLDRSALRLLDSVDVQPDEAVPSDGKVEERIAAIWREVLRLQKIGVEDNFFDVGGHSLLLVEVQMRLAEAFGNSPSMVEMFQFTTVRALAGFYADAQAPRPAALDSQRIHPSAPRGATEIAIVGMAGRFPGAADVETLWQNLCNGAEGIATFDSAQCAARGVDPALLENPSYVPAFGALADIEGFDADFFGLAPREAELTDVQHRLLLECAWAALEDAGHDPQAEGRRYGVFAGVGLNRYLLNNLMPHRELMESADPYQLMLGNDKDFATTRVSYKLNLDGPSINVQTACSTSLVAVHLACRSLLARECDAAIAGGCSIALPQDRGYLYQEGMILSPDGHCRAFDADAQGTVGGNGVGLVVLKRLNDALTDGDDIYAVIKGSAINNDGSAKAGFTAPSIAGQAAVVTAALANANVAPETIGYIEAHGTGTPLGDPIEIAALNRVFSGSDARTKRCAIGSIKTNVGHLDTAAGVAGLIKAALAVKYGKVPPSLYYRNANPALKLDKTPFFIPTELAPWPDSELPRRAGVSSFGIGGTNAHVVLEQAPEALSAGVGRPYQLVVLSAKQAPALEDAGPQLSHYLRRHPDLDLGDVAFTLASGRRPFAHRRMLVCQTLTEAADALSGATELGRRTPDLHESVVDQPAPRVAFMFSGQGSQYVGMAGEIYRTEPVFRDEVDRCAELLRRQLGRDLRELVFPQTDTPARDEMLKQTAMAQPALFVVEYALARLWMSWGIRPDAVIGHSLGEYVAACIAGVWSLEDALALVALRAECMQSQPTGGMLAISASEADACSMLTPELSLAAVNGPVLCVISGPHEALAKLRRQLEDRGDPCRPLQTSHAFHSAMMEPAAAPLTARLREVECRAPTVPIVSNVTGTWLDPAQAVDPNYWAKQLTSTVRFADGLDTLLQHPERCLIEVGPGNTLANLARRHPRHLSGQTIVTSLRHPEEQRSDAAHLLTAAGQLWLAGAQLDWAGFYKGQRRKRLHLPTYPFQRKRYWIDPRGRDAVTPMATGRRRPEEWFYVPSWQRMPPPVRQTLSGTHWLLLMDACGVGDALAKRLRQDGITVSQAYPGSGFAGGGLEGFAVDPGSSADYECLADGLRRSEGLPDVIVHLWNVTAERTSNPSTAARNRSLHSLMFLARAMADCDVSHSCRIVVVSNGLHDVTGEERLDPLKALLLGPVAVVPQEYAQISCGTIDVDLSSGLGERQVDYLLADAPGQDGNGPIAYRGAHRWQQIFLPTILEAKAPPVHAGGTYLITGGIGGVGLALAEGLARAAPGVKLALVSRSATSTSEPHQAHVRHLSAMGADVFMLSADVADKAQMQAAIEQIHERFGAIDGVIHAAGVPGSGLIGMHSRESADLELAGKVDGTLVLESILADTPLDFFVLCSSLTAITGGLGQVAYAAANAFEDAFAQALGSRRPWARTVAIGWDRWQNLGMAAALDMRYREATGEELDGGMSRMEGMDAFGRILAADCGARIVVSTRGLTTLIERSRAFQLGHAERQKPQLARHDRPNGSGDYVSPGTEAERSIAEIWQDELGIAQVGAHDDFFALGGDSLTAIKLMSRLRQALQVPLTARSIYDASTVSAMADHVETMRWVTQAPETAHSGQQIEEGAL